MSLFQTRDTDAFRDSLAKYLPGGKLFTAKNIESKGLYKLLNGLAPELFNANDLLKQYSEEYLPDQTEKFLDEWERALGIPDECFDGVGDVASRRRDIIVKLSSLGVQTVDDFVTLATLFGVVVNVFPGLDVFNNPLLVPGVTFYSKAAARYTVVIAFVLEPSPAFPYEFPILFGDDLIAILECLFNRLRQANGQVIFKQV